MDAYVDVDVDVEDPCSPSGEVQGGNSGANPAAISDMTGLGPMKLCTPSSEVQGGNSEGNPATILGMTGLRLIMIEPASSNQLIMLEPASSNQLMMTGPTSSNQLLMTGPASSKRLMMIELARSNQLLWPLCCYHQLIMKLKITELGSSNLPKPSRKKLLRPLPSCINQRNQVEYNVSFLKQRQLIVDGDVEVNPGPTGTPKGRKMKKKQFYF